MNEAEWDAIVTQTATLMEQFQRNCETLTQQQQALTQSIQQMARQAPQAMRQSADDLLKTLPETMRTQVRSGLEKSIGTLEQRLSATAQSASQNAQQLSHRLQALDTAASKLLWRTSAIVIACLSLLLAGGGWLLFHYRADIHRHQISANLLRAYDQADVVLCGDALCANVELRGAGAGDRGQYRLVLPRHEAQEPPR
jgi:exonuclease VII large subunit